MPVLKMMRLKSLIKFLRLVHLKNHFKSTGTENVICPEKLYIQRKVMHPYGSHIPVLCMYHLQSVSFDATQSKSDTNKQTKTFYCLSAVAVSYKTYKNYSVILHSADDVISSNCKIHHLNVFVFDFLCSLQNLSFQMYPQAAIRRSDFTDPKVLLGRHWGADDNWQWRDRSATSKIQISRVAGFSTANHFQSSPCNIMLSILFLFVIQLWLL